MKENGGNNKRRQIPGGRTDEKGGERRRCESPDMMGRECQKKQQKRNHQAPKKG